VKYLWAYVNKWTFVVCIDDSMFFLGFEFVRNAFFSCILSLFIPLIGGIQ